MPFCTCPECCEGGNSNGQHFSATRLKVHHRRLKEEEVRGAVSDRVPPGSTSTQKMRPLRSSDPLESGARTTTSGEDPSSPAPPADLDAILDAMLHLELSELGDPDVDNI